MCGIVGIIGKADVSEKITSIIEATRVQGL